LITVAEEDKVDEKKRKSNAPNAPKVRGGTEKEESRWRKRRRRRRRREVFRSFQT
jgi:hypothetical protein